MRQKPEVLVVGDIVRFNYLWAREAEVGEESARKPRPVCVIVRTSAEPAALFLLPLSSRPPAKTRAALAVPEIECKRGGLRSPCWIICDEYNRVTMDLAHDFESLNPIGTFSATFVRQIAASLKREAIARRAKMVVRR